MCGAHQFLMEPGASFESGGGMSVSECVPVLFSRRGQDTNPSDSTEGEEVLPVPGTHLLVISHQQANVQEPCSTRGWDIPCSTT
jgi:hypothetical protein